MFRRDECWNSMRGGIVRRRSSAAEGDRGCDTRFNPFARVRSARLELVDRARHDRFIHLGDFEALTDPLQESDVQFAAEVFAEFAKPLDDRWTAPGRALAE